MAAAPGWWFDGEGGEGGLVAVVVVMVEYPKFLGSKIYTNFGSHSVPSPKNVDFPFAGRCHACVGAVCRHIWRYLGYGGDEIERYSHEGYLIKVVVMALARQVARELSPIRSWSNNNYEI